MPSSTFSFLSGSNADFIAELYERYLKDSKSVDPSWQIFFAELKDDARAITAEMRGASWAPLAEHKIIGNGAGSNGAAPSPAKSNGAQAAVAGDTKAYAYSDDAMTMARRSVRALMMIRAYRVVGHMMADLDPLGIKTPQPLDELDPAFWGFSADDYDIPIFIDGVLGLESATLRQIMGILRSTYCQHIGWEFMHVQHHDRKQWLQARIENTSPDFAPDEKRVILQQLTQAEGFEKFLAVKFPGTKRFGLEGGESTVPALNTILEGAAAHGVKEVVFGMAHRGRLNILANTVGKSYTAIFSEFQGTAAYPESVQGSGDVKYHLGTSSDRQFRMGNIHLTLSPNPSHLEFVGPVALGRVRAKQEQYAGKTTHLSPEDFGRILGILIHGDAAFAGQGVVAETFELADLEGYRTGGTIHIVINNQIGFTTNPESSKSSAYCTDLAKKIQAPIFHVNGDDPEAVVYAARIAIDYRQQFKQDIVLDIVCYRRQGHNEGDEPAFTQPRMYKKIRALPTTRDIYAAKLAAENSVPQPEIDSIQADFHARLEKDFTAATNYKPNKAEWLEGKWSGLEIASGEDRSGSSAVDMATLKEIGHAISSYPKDLEVNPKIARQLETRMQSIDSGEGIDWGTAEALAFGALTVEGTPVRLSGQDCGRGTFSQRHAVLVDQTSEKRYLPLNHIREGKQASFEVIDSPLSETSVLGFDYGYSLAEPHALVMWEAQFGDFANGAQVIIDQFISSGETKWLRMSGIVLLLPHGYEGQGPEHSSARFERFLQLSGEDNWQVANCTTPANYFHALRRQIRRPFRKPLVLMTPKSLLRHKSCISALADMGPNSRFQRVIPENGRYMLDDKKIRRVVLCTGKVYYDLLAERDNRNIKDVAIVRVEEVYPFPHKPLTEQLKRYPSAQVVWTQEEPQNMGAWFFVDRRIEAVLQELGRKDRPSYVGRIEAASPATGSLKRHNKEQAELVNSALTVA
jgi:2-oxoglutarate dehydrogenase E1 component